MKKLDLKNPGTRKKVKFSVIVIACAAVLYVIVNFVVEPQITKAIKNKFPEMALTENAISGVFPDRPVQISVHKDYSIPGMPATETIAADIKGKPPLTQAELQGLQGPICSALQQKGGNYGVVLRNLRSGNFLVFHYSVTSEAVSFSCL